MVSSKVLERGDRVLVTGAAGFIGSHLVDALMPMGIKVTAIDDLSSGSLSNIRKWLSHKDFRFFKKDLTDKIPQTTLNRCKVVFHLAANPEVRVGASDPSFHFKQNIFAAFNLLEAIREVAEKPIVVFTSTSTVYGEPSLFPTPEDYAPLHPISIYGASKLACETLLSAYAHTFGINSVIFRLANIIGPRSRHGVIFDFINKLKRNPKELEILGDGHQTKSYLYIDDFVKAIFLGLEETRSKVEVFNVGSEDSVNVQRIAEIVIKEMGLYDTTFKFKVEDESGRGWKGDVKKMLLDIEKLKSLGFRPIRSSESAVRLATRDLLRESH